LHDCWFLLLDKVSKKVAIIVRCHTKCKGYSKRTLAMNEKHLDIVLGHLVGFIGK